jgi:hypothetical protein
LNELKPSLMADRDFNITTYSNGYTIGNNASGQEMPSLIGRGIVNPDERIGIKNQYRCGFGGDAAKNSDESNLDYQPLERIIHILISSNKNLC